MALARGRDGKLVRDAINNPVAILREMSYDLSKVRMKRLTPEKARSADKVVLIFSKKKHRGRLPKYLKSLQGLEWWDVPSISDDTPHKRYVVLEKKRIKKIGRLVKGLASSGARGTPERANALYIITVPTSTMGKERVLVLDKPSTYGLISLARQDGKAEIDGGYENRHDIVEWKRKSLEKGMRDFWSHVTEVGNMQMVREWLLPAMLLHDKVYLSGSPGDVRLLGKDDRAGGPATGIRVPGSSSTLQGIDNSFWGSSVLEFAPPELVAPIISFIVQTKLGVSIDAERMVRYIRWAEVHSREVDMQSVKAFETYRKHLVATHPFFEPIRRGGRINLNEKGEEVILPVDRKGRILKARYARLLMRSKEAAAIVVAHHETAVMLKEAARLGAGVRLPYGITYDMQPAGDVKDRLREVKRADGDAEVFFRFAFRKLAWANPKTYTEWLELSENENIRHFRSVLHDNIDEIIEGGIAQKHLNEILHASEAPGKIAKAETMATITKIVALPVEIALSLIGGGLLGHALKGVELLPHLYIAYEKRKYAWALINVAGPQPQARAAEGSETAAEAQ